MASSCSSCSPPPSPQSSDSIHSLPSFCSSPLPLPVLPDEGPHDEAPWDFTVWTDIDMSDHTLTEIEVESGAEEVNRTDITARKLFPLRCYSLILSSDDDLWSWEGCNTEEEDRGEQSNSDDEEEETPRWHPINSGSESRLPAAEPSSNKDFGYGGGFGDDEAEDDESDSGNDNDDSNDDQGFGGGYSGDDESSKKHAKF